MQDAKNRIVYWKDCDRGVIVRYMRDNGLDFMDKEKKEWISCGLNSNYYREIFIGEGNNCLRSITEDEALRHIRRQAMNHADYLETCEISEEQHDACIRGAVISTLMGQYFDDRKFDEQKIIDRINAISAPEYKKKEVLAEALTLVHNLGNARDIKTVCRTLFSISCCETVFDLHAQTLNQINTSVWAEDDFKKIREWRNDMLKSVQKIVYVDKEKLDFFLRLLIYAKATMPDSMEYLEYYHALYETDIIKTKMFKKKHGDFRIDSMRIETTANIAYRDKENSEFPYVKIKKESVGEEPYQEFIDDGWIPDGYVYYDGLFYYHKIVDIRTIVDKIKIRFTKKTEERDKIEFGFSQELTYGAYSYPIPSNLLEEISICLFECVKKEATCSYLECIPLELKETIMTAVGQNIIDDEFNSLLSLRDEHKQGLFDSIDISISEEEQKFKWAMISRRIKEQCPAYLNVFGSRSHIITDHNFDLVYQEYEKQKMIKD